MTISIATCRIQYSGNGVLTTFAYNFRILAAADLKVIVTTAAGVETVLALNTDYTITGAGVVTGGNVLLTSGTLCPTGSTLTIKRNMTINQTTDWIDGQAFSARAFEDAADKVTMAIQQVNERLGRTPYLRESYPAIDFKIPNPEASKYLGWNPTATALENKIEPSALTYAVTTIKYLSSYASFAAAIASIGSSTSTLVIDTTANITVDTTVPATLQIRVEKVGAFVIATGKTLTINGPFSAGLYQAFNCVGTGAVVGLSGTIPVAWFGVAGQGADESAAIQKAFNAATAGNSAIIEFSQGSKVAAGSAYYNLGSTTITISKAEVKITGPKYYQIYKTGSGAFFDMVASGYGFEIENARLTGDQTAGQIGIKFTGADAGAYYRGTLNGSINNCWFEGIGSMTEASETAGGAILLESQNLGLNISNNIFSQGGYALRIDGTVNGGSDGVKFNHNVCNISRSIAVQMISTAGAASVEIANNNFANVGGAFYGYLAGYINIFGNEYIPGESGTLGTCVKRDYAGSTSLAEDAGGVSAAFIFKSAQFPFISHNVMALYINSGAVTTDYGFFFSNNQGPGVCQNNLIITPAVKAIRVTPQHMFFVNNRTDIALSTDLYSNAVHPGIQHFGWDGLTTNYWGFGTQNPSAPFEIAATNIVPTDGASQFKISNSADPGKWFGVGFDTSATTGYIQAYGASAYQQIQHRSPSLFKGGSGDTVVKIQKGAAQGSALLRLLDNAGTGTGLPTYADNAAAAAGGWPVGGLYQTATGIVMIRY
jgi:hypothetical protein